MLRLLFGRGMLLAARDGQTDSLTLLLRLGASPDAVDEHSQSPLYVAAAAGNEEAVRILIEAGSRVDRRDREGVTALHGAAAGGHANCITALLEAGADATAVDREGRTPEQLAREVQHQRAAELLHRARNQEPEKER